MIPMPPSSAWTMAIGARVTVSMLAETIGRFSARCCETRHDRSIAAGSRRDDDAALRRQQEIVERAAVDQLGNGRGRRGVDARKILRWPYRRS